MKIQIELKNGNYTVTYGKVVGKGATIVEAIEKMVTSFRAELEKFFVVK